MIAWLISVAAQGLDAPVNQTPTVRSEIKNGYDTGAACDRFDMEASAVDPCFARILTEYRINHPSADAFGVGLNLRKWHVGANFVQVGLQLSGNSLAQDYAAFGKVTAGQAEIDASQGAADLKITLDQAFEAADVIPANRPKSVLSH